MKWQEEHWKETYGRSSWNEADEAVKEVGLPGAAPFVRGIHSTMYRARHWTMRQYSGFGTAQETNKRFHFLLKQGQTGLSTAFDLPTQMGFDSDHQRASGEVGRVGVAIDSLQDFQTLFDGIAIDQVSTSMTINATATTLLAMAVATAKKQGAEPSSLRGTVQNDILKEYMARGTYIYPPRPSLRLATDLIRYATDSLPKWYPISISGYHIREAGATAVEELAFTFSNAKAYVQSAIDAGLDVDQFASRLAFFFSVDINFLEEIAKFRAARKLWWHIMKHQFNAKKPASMSLRFHSQTAGSTLTAQQPMNNVVRVAMQALAAVLGGTQSIHTNSFDEALSLPTEESALVALRTQQIIAEESGVIDTVDPVGGAFAIESKTQEIFEQALELIQEIDQLGGSIGGIEQGFFQKRIAESSYAAQIAMEKNEKIMVGVNKHETREGGASIPIWSLDPALEKEQQQRVSGWRANQDQGKIRKSLDALTEAANKSEQLLTPYIVDAVESGATVGEISDSLRQVFGAYQDQGAV